MADLKYYDGTQWVTLKGSGVALSSVSVDMTNCSLTPEGATGSFTPDGTETDGTRKYKLDLTLPRGTVVTQSLTQPTGPHCVSDLWINTSPETVEFETNELLTEDPNDNRQTRDGEQLPYCPWPNGGGRDGVFVIDGVLYSTDGKNWLLCPQVLDPSLEINVGSAAWEFGTYIVKSIQDDGSIRYFDSHGRHTSTDMMTWLLAVKTSFTPAQTAADCFFWKGEFHITSKKHNHSGGPIHQCIFNTTKGWWEGGAQGGGQLSAQIDPIPEEKEIMNADVIRCGDSKPDGTEVLGLARGDVEDYAPILEGEWYAVKLVDNSPSKDSFERIVALAPYAGKIHSIKYCEPDNYWLAITDDKALKSDVGNVDQWTEIELPYSHNWTPCLWDGKKWIAVSAVTGDSLFIFSEDGEQWEASSNIPPMFDIQEDDLTKINCSIMSTDQKTLCGFSPDPCPYYYYFTK